MPPIVMQNVRTAAVAGVLMNAVVQPCAQHGVIAVTLQYPAALPTHDVTVEIHRAVTRLYDALGLQRARLRLVGVRVEGLVPRVTVHRQLVLGEAEHGWAEADRAVDRATRRFGAAAVRPASLVAGASRPG